MTVRKDASGRRSIELRFEVPGTPEQVWNAIATSNGISSWLFPTDVDEREGGAIAFHMAPGMDSTGTVTTFDPPRRFAYEEPGWSPGAPPLATEFIVETAGGGTCVVRLVHSLFTDSDQWDDEFAGFETGWRSFFQVLRLYLTHFDGQPCAPFRLMRSTDADVNGTFSRLSRALTLENAAIGDKKRAPSGAPPFAGIVESTGSHGTAREILLRLDAPAPGLALIGAYQWGGKVHASMSFYFYGAEAASVVLRDTPQWDTWLKQQFPTGGD